MKPSDSKERRRERVRKHRAMRDVTPPVTPLLTLQEEFRNVMLPKMGFEPKGIVPLDADGNVMPED